MSCLRKYPLKRPKFGDNIEFGESKFEYCDGAEDMPVIVDRLKRGMNPQTHVATFGSSFFTEEQMLSEMPRKIVDPTDVDFSKYKEEVNKQNDVEQSENTI